MTADTQMPQLQVASKLLQIPLVEYAYKSSAGIYNFIKGSNGLINWTLGSAESLAVSAMTPVATKFQQPINMIDNTLCKGIDVLQEKVPIVNDQPFEMLEKTKTFVSTSVAAERVQNITNKGWEKANEVLSGTSVGNVALTGLDTCSSIADRCVDYLLPASEGEENCHPHPSSECNDKVLHTIHTVGDLSSKIGRRVYHTIRPSNITPQHAIEPTSSSGSEESVHSSDEED